MSAQHRKTVLRAAALMLVVGGSLSLLIWGKLRLVTEVPRSAYAEPQAERPAPASTHSDAAAEANAAEPLNITGESRPTPPQEGDDTSHADASDGR